MKKRSFIYYLVLIGFTFIICNLLNIVGKNYTDLYIINFTIFIGILINTLYCFLVLQKEYKKQENLSKQIDISYSHLASIIENLPLITYITDSNYKFLTGNNEAKKFFNIKDNTYFSLLTENIYEKSSLELILSEINHIRKHKKPYETDKLVKLKNGKEIWCRTKKIPLLNNENQIRGFIVIAQDIKNEIVIQKQRETYISTLNHDLKIPTLAQIRALELLLSENMGNINLQQKELVDLTLNSCKYMYKMLSTILDTYKYENSDIKLNFEMIETVKLFDDCIIKYSDVLKRKNIEIRVKIRGNSFSTYADKKQLKKAFENLIDYCIYTAAENSGFIVEFKNIQDKLFINFAFKNLYISQEELKNMFNMYTTSAEKFDKVGSGLGLYLAKQIFDAHNGKIHVKSYDNNLVSYNIELPCVNNCKIHASSL